MQFELWLDNEVQQFKQHTLQYTDKNIKVTTDRLTEYLTKHNIKSVVIGISGGIDSSLVLAILANIKQQYITDLQIHAVNIHFSCYDGIFDFTYITLLKDKFKDVHYYDIDASNSINTLFGDIKFDTSDKSLVAQSSYALRYQILFTYAQRFNGITIGTTNKDEFSYVGWFGKSSDMVVDIQILHNYHKFEVVHWATTLGVPEPIITRKPVGDLIDRSTDEDNFGCSYDELAWYTSMMDSHGERPYYDDLMVKFQKVIDLHKKNLHKYQGQGFNPIFLDI